VSAGTVRGPDKGKKESRSFEKNRAPRPSLTLKALDMRLVGTGLRISTSSIDPPRTESAAARAIAGRGDRGKEGA